MKITDFAVTNWRFTLVAFLGILALGVSSLLVMPRAEDPPYHAPSFYITVVYPGTSPLDMEKLVVKPVEKRLQNLENLKHLSTSIRNGVAQFEVDYKYGSNIDSKYQEITREMGALKAELPPDLALVDIVKASSDNVNIYQFALVSETQPFSVLKAWSEDLKKRLQQVRSLKSVDVWAYPKEQIRVDLDVPKLSAAGIPVDRVLGAIQADNVNIPGGGVGAGGRTFDVTTGGEFKTPADLAATVVYTTGTSAVRLSDVASVSRGYETETYRARLNGHRAVFLTMAMHEGQNIQTVRDEVLPVIDGFRKVLPPSPDLVKIFDQPSGVEHRLGRFSADFTIAILLVLLTLLPLGGRASLVVMAAIPLSLALGLTVLYALGFNINQLSIVGMIVALGILVDDSIVVVENIERWLRSGATRTEAAIGAARQIAGAILGCTILLCLAFLPLLFLPEGTGEFIRSLPAAVVACVLSSLFVALTVVPFLSSRVLSEKKHPGGNVFLRFVDRVIIGGSEPLVRRALSRPRTTLAAVLVLFAASLMLFPVIGSSLFPKSEKPMFLVNITRPAGTSLDQTDQTALRVEALLRAYPGISSVAASVGHDNPIIYYNVGSRDASENTAQLFVQLSDPEPRFKLDLIGRLREAVKNIPDAKIEVQEFGQGPPVAAPVAFRIFDDDLGTLDRAAALAEGVLTRTPGTLYVSNPLSYKPTDLRLTVNKEKAGLLGLSSAEVAKAVRLGISGLDVGAVRVDGDGDDLPIHVTLGKTGRVQDLSAFDRIYVTTSAGVPVPLGQVAALGFDTGVNQILHYDSRRYVTVGSFVGPGNNVGAVSAAVQKQLGTLDLDGARVEVSGEAETGSESFSGLQLIILVTLFGFIGVLILEFKSFKSIVIVLSILPLGIIGALGMLWLFHESFSFTATIGLIALSGIEVKNSLLFVDFANLLRTRGRPLEEAILEAGRMRFVPILLTSLTAVGGLVPLVIEYSPLYSPLALVLIGGILTSTALARFVTPVLYRLLPPEVEVVSEVVDAGEAEEGECEELVATEA